MSRIKQTEDAYSSPDLLVSKFRGGRSPFFEIEIVTQNVQASSSGGGTSVVSGGSGGLGGGGSVIIGQDPYGGDKFNSREQLEQ